MSVRDVAVWLVLAAAGLALALVATVAVPAARRSAEPGAVMRRVVGAGAAFALLAAMLISVVLMVPGPDALLGTR